MKLPTFFKKNHKVTGAAAPTQASSAGRGHNARILRDWVLVVGSFVFLVLVAAAVNGYLLLRINKGNFFAVDPENGVSTETLNRKTLFDVSSFFELRQKEYEESKRGGTASSSLSSAVDPSL